ncbi:hypothetical protein AB1Y20_004861 [Prymnesium parvum]|uniref:Uncharacterized protein n=1 Tax=Prymnesium parvum TaxID=97485 RepID=A0AB34IXN6_PRYPA
MRVVEPLVDLASTSHQLDGWGASSLRVDEASLEEGAESMAPELRLQLVSSPMKRSRAPSTQPQPSCAPANTKEEMEEDSGVRDYRNPWWDNEPASSLLADDRSRRAPPQPHEAQGLTDSELSIIKQLLAGPPIDAAVLPTASLLPFDEQWQESPRSPQGRSADFEDVVAPAPVVEAGEEGSVVRTVVELEGALSSEQQRVGEGPSEWGAASESEAASEREEFEVERASRREGLSALEGESDQEGVCQREGLSEWEEECEQERPPEASEEVPSGRERFPRRERASELCDEEIEEAIEADVPCPPPTSLLAPSDPLQRAPPPPLPYALSREGDVCLYPVPSFPPPPASSSPRAHHSLLPSARAARLPHSAPQPSAGRRDEPPRAAARQPRAAAEAAAARARVQRQLAAASQAGSRRARDAANASERSRRALALQSSGSACVSVALCAPLLQAAAPSACALVPRPVLHSVEAASIANSRRPKVHAGGPRVAHGMGKLM